MTVRSLALLISAILAVLLVTTCVPAPEPPTIAPEHVAARAAAEAMARTVNATGEILIAAWEEDGGWVAGSDAESRWEPVWLAWDALRVAYAALADGLERGGAPDPAPTMAAFCALVAVVPDRKLTTRLDLLGVPCPEPGYQ